MRSSEWFERFSLLQLKSWLMFPSRSSARPKKHERNFLFVACTSHSGGIGHGRLGVCSSDEWRNIGLDVPNIFELLSPIGGLATFAVLLNCCRRNASDFSDVLGVTDDCLLRGCEKFEDRLEFVKILVLVFWRRIILTRCSCSGASEK